MNTPHAEFLRGAKPGEYYLTPQDIFLRRNIIAEGGNRQEALRQLQAVLEAFGLSLGHGLSRSIEAPESNLCHIVWSALYAASLAEADEVLVFSSYAKLHELETKHPQYFQGKKAAYLQACSLEHCSLPATGVAWRTLALFNNNG
jgi:hypothetical protein